MINTRSEGGCSLPDLGLFWLGQAGLQPLSCLCIGIPGVCPSYGRSQDRWKSSWTIQVLLKPLLALHLLIFCWWKQVTGLSPTSTRQEHIHSLHFLGETKVTWQRTLVCNSMPGGNEELGPKTNVYNHHPTSHLLLVSVNTIKLPIQFSSSTNHSHCLLQPLDVTTWVEPFFSDSIL